MSLLSCGHDDEDGSDNIQQSTKNYSKRNQNSIHRIFRPSEWLSSRYLDHSPGDYPPSHSIRHQYEVISPQQHAYEKKSLNESLRIRQPVESNPSMNDEKEVDLDFVDKLLAESIRLKKKCKALKDLIHSMEEQNQEDAIKSQQEASQRELSAQGFISELEAKHFLDVQSMRDMYSKELDTLRANLKQNDADIFYKDKMIGSLRDKLAACERALSQQQLNYTQSINELKTKCQTDLNDLHRQISEYSTVNESALQRAIIAENQLIRYRDIIDKNEETLTQLHGELNTLKLEAVNMKETMSVYVATIDRSRNEISSTYATLAEKQADIDRLVKHNTTLQELLDDCTSRGGEDESSDYAAERDIEGKYHEALDVLQQARSEIVSLQERIQIIEQAKDEIASGVDKVVQENELLRNQLKSLLNLKIPKIKINYRSNGASREGSSVSLSDDDFSPFGIKGPIVG